MKRNILNISLYWKCQFLGWGATLFIINFMVSYPELFYLGSTIRFLSVNMITGILFSHVMRVFILKLNLKERSFWKLIFPICILTIFFGTCYGIFSRISVELIRGWNVFSIMRKNQLIDLGTQAIIDGTFLFTFWNIIYFFYQNQQRNKRQEQEKTILKIQTIEMEARALRAQMNPHFIFNCLNSIKSLIQQHDEEKSITYLTTFSKLIRNLFNNADKKEISLHDEIETCKLYLQLEAMRFDTKFSYAVQVDDNIDLKSIQVPALIIQPFIENAIWHGIMPHNSTGHVSLNVLRKDGIIEVVIDDDGIGREASQKIKSTSSLAHQSKGVNLTQTRLELNNLLQQRQAELEMIDKKDENGTATGTTVIVKIKEELS
jgi:sensor histidine kinase YesM